MHAQPHMMIFMKVLGSSSLKVVADTERRCIDSVTGSTGSGTIVGISCGSVVQYVSFSFEWLEQSSVWAVVIVVYCITSDSGRAKSNSVANNCAFALRLFRYSLFLRLKIPLAVVIGM